MIDQCIEDTVPPLPLLADPTSEVVIAPLIRDELAGDAQGNAQRQQTIQVHNLLVSSCSVSSDDYYGRLDSETEASPRKPDPVDIPATAYRACLESLVNSLRAQVSLARDLTGLLTNIPQEFRVHAFEAVGRLSVGVEEFYSELSSAASGKVCTANGGHSNGSVCDGPYSKITRFAVTGPGTEAEAAALPKPDDAYCRQTSSDESKIADEFTISVTESKPAEPCVPHLMPAPLAEGRGEDVAAVNILVPERRVVQQGIFSPKSARSNRIRAPRVSVNFDSAHEENDGQEQISSSQICYSGTFNPDWSGRKLWDTIVIMLVLVDSVFLPFQLTYKIKSHYDGFDTVWLWLLTSFFAVDILLNFFTAFPAGVGDPSARPGSLVIDKGRIAKEYCSTWFVFDLLATMPWVHIAEELNAEAGGFAQVTRGMKVIRVIRMVRMLRLAKVNRLWRKFNKSIGSFHVLQAFALCRVLFIMVVICHWNACMWWLIGQPRSWLSDMILTEEQAKIYELEPHWTTVERNAGPHLGTWTWESRDTSDVYVFCFYWTLGVMRTMPAEVTPVNTPERIYIMIFMFFAFSVFGICVATVTQAWFKVGDRDRTFAEDMVAVRGHLKSIEVPKALQDTIDNCLRLMFEKRRIQAKESAIINVLPELLKQKVDLFAKAMHLRKLNVLQGVPETALLHVATITEVMMLLPDDVVCQRGEEAEAAWVLMNGSLHALQGTHEESRVVVDQECLNDFQSDSRWQSHETVIAVVCSEVVKVEREPFLQAAGETPAIMKQMMVLATTEKWSERDWKDQDVAVEAEMPLLGGMM